MYMLEKLGEHLGKLETFLRKLKKYEVVFEEIWSKFRVESEEIDGNTEKILRVCRNFCKNFTKF